MVFGKASGFAANLDLSSLDGTNGFRISGEAAYDDSGFSVASAGDVNGDGFADLIIGAPFARDYNAGISYVIYGGKPGEAVTRIGTDIAQTIRGGDFDDRLSGLGGNDTLVGYGGADDIRGGVGDDDLSGGGGNDKLAGQGGADELKGSGGNDQLKGGSGDDSLSGGEGFDLFVGGTGEDTFAFNATAEIGSLQGARDVIRDFVHRGDHIDLSAIDADANLDGDQAFTFIGMAEFSAAAGELRFARTAAGVTLVAGDVDGDGAADFRLEIGALVSLAAVDFVL